MPPRAALRRPLPRTRGHDATRVRLPHPTSVHKLGPGAVAHLNPGDAPSIGARDGHTVKVVTTRGEGEFTCVLDEGTPTGVVYVPFNQQGASSLGSDPVVRVTTS